MKDKKLMLEARKSGFQALRDDMKDLMKEEGLGHFSKLMPKKMMKVTVAAPDEKSLEKGLSKAEQILKAKMGEPSEESKMESPLEESMEDEMESEEECEDCQGKGCPLCQSEESEESLPQESNELELLKKENESLKQQLAKLSK